VLRLRGGGDCGVRVQFHTMSGRQFDRSLGDDKISATALKNMILSWEQIPEADQILYHEGKELGDDDRLSASGVKSGSNIYILQKSKIDDGSIAIFIKTT